MTLKMFLKYVIKENKNGILYHLYILLIYSFNNKLK